MPPSTRHTEPLSALLAEELEAAEPVRVRGRLVLEPDVGAPVHGQGHPAAGRRLWVQQPDLDLELVDVAGCAVRIAAVDEQLAFAPDLRQVPVLPVEVLEHGLGVAAGECDALRLDLR